MPYNFNEQLAKGDRGEDFIQEYFSRWYTVTRASAIQQRQGIDFLFLNPKTQELWRVELTSVLH
jgi:hypothetical protein